jgi:dolichyl-phosphate-mannose-protein mannosyltransferase
MNMRISGTESGSQHPERVDGLASQTATRATQGSVAATLAAGRTAGRRLAWVRTRQTVLSVVFLCALGGLLAARGIRSEATGSFQGDMPRYLMNGAYFHDLITDLPFRNPIEYTYAYYARYPALSLGFHPLLPGALVTPFYFLFGISVFAGRVATISLLLVTVLAWFFLVRSIYDERIALLSSLLLTTTPYVIGASRVVMSEIPALAMLTLTTFLFVRYCQSGRRTHLFLFAVVAGLSGYAKHHCVFMLPAFALYFVLTKGWRRLFAWDLALAAVLIVALLAPLVPLTLNFSRANVAWVSGQGIASRLQPGNLLYYLQAIWRYHLTPPVTILSTLGFVLALFRLWRGDRRPLLFVLWIVLFYVQLTYTGTQVARYAIYWVPPFCLLATLVVDAVPRRSWKVLATAAVVVIAAYQFADAWLQAPEYGAGYEEAARYVVDHRKGDSVLYAAEEDSGFFTFFVRKHDRDRDLIVLRADKLLATSALFRIIEDRITNPQEIHDILHDFGTGYVVIEEKDHGSFRTHPMLLLQQLVDSGVLVLRERIPLRTNSRRLDDVKSIGIYEYTGYAPRKPGQMLRMRIPLMAGEVDVPFDRLTPR